MKAYIEVDWAFNSPFFLYPSMISLFVSIGVTPEQSELLKDNSLWSKKYPWGIRDKKIIYSLLFVTPRSLRLCGESIDFITLISTLVKIFGNSAPLFLHFLFISTQERLYSISSTGRSPRTVTRIALNFFILSPCSPRSSKEKRGLG